MRISAIRKMANKIGDIFEHIIYGRQNTLQ